MSLTPVILSGGSGSRLWPLSREEYPKHLIPLLDQQTLLQKTLLRLQGLPCKDPIVVGNHQQRFMIAEQLQHITVAPEALILEPIGRNTAPAIAIASLLCEQRGEATANLLVLPADHVITDVAAFQQGVTRAHAYCEQGSLVTFGIVPTEPHTGYGYIQRGKALDAGAFQVAQFVEKPDMATAEQYLATGQYSWNSGMFLFRADVYLQTLQQFHPDMVQACRAALAAAQQDLDFLRLEAEAFAHCPDISIDYAVMEKTDKAVVVPMDAGWNDVGSWSSLAEVCPHDAHGNVLQGDVLVEGTQDCFIHANSRFVTAVGVKDHVIVETADAVLVADKNQVQDVKKIVQHLKANHRDERLHHTTRYRPWGQHELLVQSPGFEVRRVLIKPGAHIAMQRHHQRTEHWVVVSGQADIVCDGQSLVLCANESFYVKKGATHRIANTGDQPLIFIEVQLGECLKEDDIERLENNP